MSGCRRTVRHLAGCMSDLEVVYQDMQDILGLVTHVLNPCGGEATRGTSCAAVGVQEMILLVAVVVMNPHCHRQPHLGQG